MATRSKLTKAQLETLRRKLEDERSRIIRVLQTPAETASGDEGSEIEETAQRATERTQQIGVAERERALLAEIEGALARLGAGTYGVSEESGAPIPYERLTAVPWARNGADE